MTDETSAAAAPQAAPPPAEPPATQPPQPQPQPVSESQAREALAAVLEVMNGAAVTRVLELAERIALGKLVLTGLVSGQISMGTPRAPTSPAAPANRHARRSAKHKG